MTTPTAEAAFNGSATAPGPYYGEGPYKCRVLDQGFNEAKTGTAQFWLKFLVLERIEPFNDGIEQFSRTAYFPITEKTADRLMHDLHTLGYTGHTFDGLDPQLPNHHSFVSGRNRAYV
jgi:hypothetical protein